MSSAIEVCKLALSHIRAGNINSFEDGTSQSEACKRFYEILKRKILEDAEWQFAKSVDKLVLSDKDPFNWTYAYFKPSDTLKIERVVPAFERVESGAGSTSRGRHYLDEEFYDYNNHVKLRVEYEIVLIDGKEYICTNEPDAYLSYTKNVGDDNLFPANFVMALSYLLAAEMAVILMGEKVGYAAKRSNYQAYDSYIREAQRNNYNNQHSEVRESDFISVRR